MTHKDWMLRLFKFKNFYIQARFINNWDHREIKFFFFGDLNRGNSRNNLRIWIRVEIWLVKCLPNFGWYIKKSEKRQNRAFEKMSSRQDLLEISPQQDIESHSKSHMLFSAII